MKYMKLLILIVFITIILISCKNYKTIPSENNNENHIPTTENDQTDNQNTPVENNENVQNDLEEDPKGLELEMMDDVDLSKLELIDTLADGTILYFQKSAYGEFYFKQEYGESIVIKKRDKFYSLIKEQPSRPRVNKQKDKVMFLDSVGFETRANVFIYDIQTNKIEQITYDNYAFDPNDSNTIKYCDWIDDDLAILIIGFDTGTITQGGDVFLLEISTGAQKKVFTANDREEVANIYFDGDEVVFEIVYYTDDNFMDYEYRDERYKIEEILDVQ